MIETVFQAQVSAKHRNFMSTALVNDCVNSVLAVVKDFYCKSYASAAYAVIMRLSQVAVVQRRLKLGWQKQCYTIAQEL